MGMRLLLDTEVPLQLCMRMLPAEAVLALSATSGLARCALWHTPEAVCLWEQRASHEFSAQVLENVRESCAHAVSSSGSSLYCCALASGCIRVAKLSQSVEVVSGSVADVNLARSLVDQIAIVACPCRSDLIDLGFGAQAAVRRVAGEPLEQAIEAMQTKNLVQPEASTTVVAGGQLAQYVAVTITTVPYYVYQSEEAADAFLKEVHDNLLHEVRVAGLRSLAMPTLCTGGQGLDPRKVCKAAARAVLQDFCKYPTQPLRVVVCCFEMGHEDLMQKAWNEAVESYRQQPLRVSDCL